jgi:hypothetical protein
MAKDHALNAQMIRNICLFATSCNCKFAIYIANRRLYKAAQEGGSYQSATDHSRSNTFFKNRREEQKLTTTVRFNSKVFIIFPPKYLLCIVCTINIFSKDRGCRYSTKEAKTLLC